MKIKTLKFRDQLAKLIVAGQKKSTWRLFDDKDLAVGDVLNFINFDSGEIFAKAELIDVYEKRMEDLNADDFDGHEKYSNQEEMYKTYRLYYGDKVGPDTPVKIIHFKLISSR